MSCYQRFVIRQILQSYLRGDCDKVKSEAIKEAATEMALNQANVYIIEIAYSIGYANSILTDVSEVTYKRIKQAVYNNIIKNLKGENTNGSN